MERTNKPNRADDRKWWNYNDCHHRGSQRAEVEWRLHKFMAVDRAYLMSESRADSKCSNNSPEIPLRLKGSRSNDKETPLKSFLVCLALHFPGSPSDFLTISALFHRVVKWWGHKNYVSEWLIYWERFTLQKMAFILVHQIAEIWDFEVQIAPHKILLFSVGSFHLEPEQNSKCFFSTVGLNGTYNGSILTFSRASNLQFCTHSCRFYVHCMMCFWGLKVKIRKMMRSHLLLRV